MYLNQNSRTGLFKACASWSLTWDVFKSKPDLQMPAMLECWSLTWDVFKLGILPFFQPKKASWSLTWDVFKSVDNGSEFLDYEVEA